MNRKQKIDYNASRLSIFASYIRPHGREFLTDMTLSVAIALVDLIFPIVSRKAMQTLLPEKMFHTLSGKRTPPIDLPSTFGV